MAITGAMSDQAYATRPQQAARQPAPKPQQPVTKPKPVQAPVANRVPELGELTGPEGPASLDDASTDGMANAIAHGVEGLYKGYELALEHVLGTLSEPPPPPDRGFAEDLLALLAKTLTSVAMFQLGGVLAGMLQNHAASQQTVREGFKLAGKDGGGAVGAWLYDVGVVGRDPAREALDQKKLVGEFGHRQRLALNAMRTNAQTTLDVARAAITKSDPAAVRTLADALITFVNTPSNFDDFERRMAIEWLNFSAAISVGHRKPGETAMRGANTLAGPRGLEWRQNHQGFLEIEVELPDIILKTEGLRFVSAVLEGAGRGAVAMVRRKKSHLLELNIYRRLWIGQGKAQRSPDVIITPFGTLEVNERSNMLAALGRTPTVPNVGLDFQSVWLTGASDEGELEQIEREPTAAKQMEERKRQLLLARRERARHAQEGASALVVWLAKKTLNTDVIR
jgi:hypothetical protein